MEKETRVTFAPGNKTLVLSVTACCIAVTLLFEAMLYERKSRLRMYEKSYSLAMEKLEENNRIQK